MLTAERMQQIENLVAAWNRDERLKEEYPSDDWPLGLYEIVNDDEYCRAIVSRAAREIGVDERELREYFIQSMPEIEQEIIEEGIEDHDADDE